LYLGDASGWSSSPDVEIPTMGATDAAVAQLIVTGMAGYLSRPITVDEQAVGAFDTFGYDAVLDGTAKARVQIVDADSWGGLAETALTSGSHEWGLEGMFRVREHPRVRVLLTATGLDTGSLSVDGVWLNWTARVKQAPRVLDLAVDAPSVLRSQEVIMWVNVTDEFDLPEELDVTVQHHLSDPEGKWESHMVSSIRVEDGTTFRITIRPSLASPLGHYDFRVVVKDTDRMYCNLTVFPNVLEVLNNLPTAPSVRLGPETPVTTSNLEVEVVTSATDLESPAITYHYRWFRDGVLLENETGEELPSSYTTRGENWSVEVRAFDGDGEGPPALAWVVVQNSPPMVLNQPPDPEIYEDTPDAEWLNVLTVFEDPDGDVLTFTIHPPPEHLDVAIDPETGVVTLVPEEDWHGEVTLTIIATDSTRTSPRASTSVSKSCL
jgi:hypothetical protein